MQAFRLEGAPQSGSLWDRYQSVELSSRKLPIPSINLSLGLWQGCYENIERLWLRWMTLDGELVLTPQEQNQRLLEKLQKLGVELE